MTERLLTIMGSGETSPTMVKVHRRVLERVGGTSARAVLLDMPFAFQENADEIARRAVAYFRESLHVEIEVASSAGEFAPEQVTTAVRGADYVFAGPGSPSYALRRWRETVVPQLLAEKLESGGAVTFASAAALTLGVATVPVYEIYKVGEDPHWLEGMDLLSRFGLAVAVVPHYDNAEGGTHDTRYCYLGERRLSAIEPELPAGAFVLGVDEHTAIVLDLGAGEASIEGLGQVTVRAGGRSATLASGKTLPIAELAAMATRARTGARAGAGAGAGDQGEAGTGARQRGAGGGGGGAGAGDGGRGAGRDPAGSGESGVPGPGEVPPVRVSPLVASVREREAAFAAALAERDVERAVAAVLALEGAVVDWSTDVPAGDELDRTRASLRSMIVVLGQLAGAGARDPAEVVGPFVETLLGMRARARAEGRFAEADAVREALGGLGVEVRDSPAGTEWLLAPRAPVEGEGQAR